MILLMRYVITEDTVVGDINQAINAADVDSVYRLLCSPEANFDNVLEPQAVHYYTVLKRARDDNSQVHSSIIFSSGR